ncbi:type IX secretion system membrane protein PorP/SprF [uncultured Tenacibaculum sp.]|uniref:PorP/SprF family type IX secretion system membrane protein n=1 Tax=uncultured Tenacibaculum sp. TaxID=174713 RepID=UPI002632D99E|nr:type IX secretion system membrane protein PorP/SprF [uncultured Tenacibaculum sp.]
MKRKKKRCLLFVLLIIVNFCTAQQDAQYTQYMYNTISVNPAYAGNKGALNVVALYRNQWQGLEGAPTTQTLAVDTPLGVLQRLGLGLSVINEKIGPTSETYINLDLSYRIPVSEEGELSFGLKGVAHLLSVDFNKLDLFDLDDSSFSTSITNKFSPNIGVGMYYNTDRFYLGLSVPNLLETNHFNTNQSLGEERINYYLISGYVFDLNNNIKFKPALLTKLVFGTPLQIDLSANFMFYEKFTLGLAYRVSAALSALVGFRISNSLTLGFAYDRETTELGNTRFNSGSYEAMLRYDLPKISIRRLTPRFF